MKDLPYVTFDSNMLISVLNNEKGVANDNEKKIAALTHKLLGFNHASVITVSVTLTSLLELTYGGRMDQQELTSWLMELGIAQENIYRGTRHLDQGFALNRRLQEILSPSIPFYLDEHIVQECQKLGIVGAKLEAMNEIYLDDVHPFYIPPSADASRNRPTPYLDALDESGKEELFELYKRLEKGWRRGKWDSLALYEHITNAVYAPHPEHSIFVTNDLADFIKEGKLEAIRGCGFSGKILNPEDAIDFIRGMTNSLSDSTSSSRAGWHNN
jgi:hypothetical protein